MLRKAKTREDAMKKVENEMVRCVIGKECVWCKIIQIMPENKIKIYCGKYGEFIKEKNEVF